MLGKTHMAVGVAASLLLLQPRTLPELILGAGAAAVGSVISDINCGTSESSRRADQIILIPEADEQQLCQPHCTGLRRLSGCLRLWKENTTPLVSAFLSCRRSADELCWHIPSDAGAVFWNRVCIPSGTGFSESQGRADFLSVPETVQPGNLYGIRTG